MYVCINVCMNVSTVAIRDIETTLVDQASVFLSTHRWSQRPSLPALFLRTITNLPPWTYTVCQAMICCNIHFHFQKFFNLYGYEPWRGSHPSADSTNHQETATLASEFLLPCKRNQKIAKSFPKRISCEKSPKRKNGFFLAQINFSLRKKMARNWPRTVCQQGSEAQDIYTDIYMGIHRHIHGQWAVTLDGSSTPLGHC